MTGISTSKGMSTSSPIFGEDQVNSIAKTINRNVPNKYIPDILRTPYKRWRARKRIDQLDITDSGYPDRYPYITLSSGVTLYGFPSKPTYLCFYEQLRKDQKENLVPEAYFTAEQIYLSLVRGHFDREVQYTIQPGDTVVDIGPHHGYYAHQLAKRVGSDGRVIAVEAHPDNYDVLTQNITENNLSNVTAINKAVTDQTGIIEFYNRETDSGKHHTLVGEKFNNIGEHDVIEVAAEPLDEILQNIDVEDVDLVSITVNLAEYEVLKGMSKTLANGTHVACPWKVDRNNIKSIFKEYDYTTTICDDYYVSPIIYAQP